MRGATPLSWAALAGLLGACAGAAFKCALHPPSLSSSMLLSFRLVCGALGVGANAAMLWAFARALRAVGSPAATLTSAAANLISSAAFGFMLGEHVGMHWLVGTILVLIGLVLLHRGLASEKNKIS